MTYVTSLMQVVWLGVFLCSVNQTFCLETFKAYSVGMKCVLLCSIRAVKAGLCVVVVKRIVLLVHITVECVSAASDAWIITVPGQPRCPPRPAHLRLLL